MPTLVGFHHIKIPVADVEKSLDWYQRVLGLQVAIEFVEAGIRQGVALRDPDGTLMLALRQDPDHAGALTGFDPVAFAVPDVAALRDWVTHLDELGITHDPLAQGTVGWLVGGVTDPDGIEVRLYTVTSR
jgi:catechol 2,3-dioxygenase-like lactoylglutathione lyase family enzyme